MTADQDVQSAALCRDMCRRLQLFGFDRRRVVDRVMQRLEIGQQRYGELDLSAPRNWRAERCEERLDALVYDVCEELAAEDLARAELREAALREMLEWQGHQRTAISTESAEIAKGEPIRIALDDLDDRPYAGWDLSDVEVG